MSTVRATISQALRLLRASSPGDAPDAEELSVGLEGAQALVLEIHEARGPLLTLDISANWTPGENQRLRVQAGADVTVTLPNTVAMSGSYDPYDYGFNPSACDAAANPALGSTGPADYVAWRPPTDGARIEIVGTQSGLYFYREDDNAWVPALSLTLDSELPFNQRLQGAFAALLAERLADVLGESPEVTPAQKARLTHAREQMFTRTGAHRSPTRGAYF
jgi:hypothetical protein